MTPRRKIVEPIPEFATREEEAEFWDTHSLADYWDQFKPTEIRFTGNLSEDITVRLDPSTLSALREEANAEGVGATTLAGMWIVERLAQRSRPRRRPAS